MRITVGRLGSLTRQPHLCSIRGSTQIQRTALPVPRQKVVDAHGGMIREARGRHVGKRGLRIDMVERGSGNHGCRWPQRACRRHRSRRRSYFFFPRRRPIARARWHGSTCAKAPVVKEAGECIPAIEADRARLRSSGTAVEARLRQLGASPASPSTCMCVSCRGTDLRGAQSRASMSRAWFLRISAMEWSRVALQQHHGHGQWCPGKDFEPSRPLSHWHLKPARLPIPPPGPGPVSTDRSRACQIGS